MCGLPYRTLKGRSPHGERGLKSIHIGNPYTAGVSLSSWRAWIEMRIDVSSIRLIPSLSSWRAWIEIFSRTDLRWTRRSLSSWRAWIEMSRCAASSRMPLSLSSWRAWIEIRRQGRCYELDCRSPHGERGLKSARYPAMICKVIRSPHGERGLK